MLLNISAKINTIMKLINISKKELLEAVQQDSKETGFLAEDLAKICEAEHSEWSAPQEPEEFLMEMKSWLK